MRGKMRKKSFWQFLKFALVGVSNTLISEGIYGVCVFFRMHYLPASFLGFSLSVVNAYFWNARYVFKADENQERSGRKTFLKTYVAYFWGYLVNAALLVFWIDIVRISGFLEAPGRWFAARGLTRVDAALLGDLLAAFLNQLITVPMNFLLNKYWAFRLHPKKS